MTAPAKSFFTEPAGWYAIHTRYRFERKVTTLLQCKGVETFLPALRELHGWSDRQKVVNTPLFSGYLFARCDLSSRLRKDLLSTQGVIGLVCFGREAVPVPDKQIYDLRMLLSQKVPCALHPFLKLGQKVRIGGGCLDGLEGILEYKGEKKLVISIHSPGSPIPAYDRFAFALTVFVVLLRTYVLRKPLRIRGPVTLPLFALLVLALCATLTQPYEAETWSMFAAKWLLPFVLYLLAGYIFQDGSCLRQFEVFALLVLAYLSLISIFFMVGPKDFIYPRYILDEGLGIHADRARGPFLQAVANGVALNLLGLLALDAFRRGRLRGLWAFLLLGCLPLAIVATRTRAVWFSFAGSILVLPFFSQSRRLRRGCVCLVVAGALGLVILVSSSDDHRSLSERLAETGPVQFRLAVYKAGWEMFLEKPLFGWNARAMQAELANHISDFHQEEYYFHNTYLEILVQYGLVGLALYTWVVIDLCRLGRKPHRCFFPTDGNFLDERFRSLWPLIVGVYLVNGSFVVMNYQFVNGFLFALAGMLAAQNRHAAKQENALLNRILKTSPPIIR